MENFKFGHSTITAAIRMGELDKDSVPKHCTLKQNPTTTEFGSCFKGGVLSVDAFKQALSQTEQPSQKRRSADPGSPDDKAAPPTIQELLHIYSFTVPYHHDSPCRKAVTSERQRLCGVLEYTRVYLDKGPQTDVARSRVRKALKELERIHIRCIEGSRGVHHSDMPPAYVDSPVVNKLLTNLYPVFKEADTGARYGIKEHDVEVKPNAEEKTLTEDPLYTFVITEVDTL